ncbi:hypothetical protein LCGC14_1824430 [marine sediment metagenome]|uniref:HNH nuclease domain-containing protein n=1 Tax=marine sediment metagenome TaxID=412755 RepID=A0A0F9IXN6_9ZZZZ
MKRNGKNINCKICKKGFYVSKSRFKRTACSRNCSLINLKNHIKINGAWNKGLKKETDERVMSYTINSTKSRKGNVYPHMLIKGRPSKKKGTRLSIEQRIKISLSKSGDKEFITFKNKLVKRIRMNKKYLEWRSNVFKRDNYHCQHCGEKGYLEAHHIYPFRKIILDFRIINLNQALNCKVLWDEGNGITYCGPCHILLDKNIGKGLIKSRRI